MKAVVKPMSVGSLWMEASYSDEKPSPSHGPSSAAPFLFCSRPAIFLGDP